MVTMHACMPDRSRGIKCSGSAPPTVPVGCSVVVVGVVVVVVVEEMGEVGGGIDRLGLLRGWGDN